MINKEKIVKDCVKKYTKNIISDFVKNFRYDVCEIMVKYYENNKNNKKYTKNFEEGFKECSDIILNTLIKSENTAKEKINRIIDDEDLNKNAF